ncbi:LOW QUALITY PROTEIN: uncharacterized protein PRD47_017633 [Ara ararauna]
MFSPMGCRRGFPRQPGPWQAGPAPPRPYGPQDMWDEMPQRRRGRAQWCPVRGHAVKGDGAVGVHLQTWGSQNQEFSREKERQKELSGAVGRGKHSKSKPRELPSLQPDPWESFPGPAVFHVDEEDREWAPNDCLLPPSWHSEECDQGPEECFGEGWYSVWGGGPGGWQLRGCPQCSTGLTGGDLPLQPWFCEPRPFPGPDDFYGNEEDRRWAPSDWSPPHHWGNEGCDQGPEVCFGEGWYPVRRNGPEGWQLCGCSLCATVLTGGDFPLQPWSCYPGPFPGPADYCGSEEYRAWAPNDWSAPCFWGDRDDGGPQECFGEGWHPEMMPPGPDCSAWPEFPSEEQHPPWPPAHQSGKRDGFQDGCRPWGFRGPPRRRCRPLRRGRQKLTMAPRLPCLWPRGMYLTLCSAPAPRCSAPAPGAERGVAPAVFLTPQGISPPLSPLPLVRRGGSSRISLPGWRPARCCHAPDPHCVLQDLPAAGQEVPKCPRASGISQKSPAADPQAVTEAVEPEQAAGAVLVGDHCSPGAPLEVSQGLCGQCNSSSLLSRSPFTLHLAVSLPSTGVFLTVLQGCRAPWFPLGFPLAPSSSSQDRHMSQPHTTACPRLSWGPRRNLRAAKALLLWKQSQPRRRRALLGQGCSSCFSPSLLRTEPRELAVPFANPFTPFPGRHRQPSAGALQCFVQVEEPCSQSTPAAGAGSHPCSPTAPPEPAEPPQGQQCTTEAASAGVSLGVGSPIACPPWGRSHRSHCCRQGCAGSPHSAHPHSFLVTFSHPNTCRSHQEVPQRPMYNLGRLLPIPAPNQTSPGTQHPPGSSEVKPAAGGSYQLCSGLPNPSPASTDLRSAAVLARKEKIELSYQQFSLTIAVVATMLLQKEPSMEAALGLALRANLRQGRIHHLQELEDFINSYDSAAPSH